MDQRRIEYDMAEGVVEDGGMEDGGCGVVHQISLEDLVMVATLVKQKRYWPTVCTEYMRWALRLSKMSRTKGLVAMETEDACRSSLASAASTNNTTPVRPTPAEQCTRVVGRGGVSRQVGVAAEEQDCSARILRRQPSLSRKSVILD